MIDTLALMVNPTVQLYCLIALTYGTASRCAGQDGHCQLARCYGASALLHALLGLAHFFHI